MGDGRRTTRAGWAAALVVVAGGLVPADADPAADDKAARGAELYRVYCRSCHGDRGRGDGPTASELQVAPADLTRLAADNDGRFPRERVRATIDGRDEMPSHRGREMPIWGDALREWDSDVPQEEQVRARIEQLVEYLRTLQAGMTASDDRDAPPD